MLLETQQLSCCFLLTLTSTPAGILAVALAGLTYFEAYSTEKAMKLVLLLRCLVSTPYLLNSDKAENIATLLRMQGLSRISGHLCSVSSPPAASANDLQEGALLLPLWGHPVPNVDAQFATVVRDVNYVVCFARKRACSCLCMQNA